MAHALKPSSSVLLSWALLFMSMWLPSYGIHMLHKPNAHVFARRHRQHKCSQACHIDHELEQPQLQALVAMISILLMLHASLSGWASMLVCAGGT